MNTMKCAISILIFYLTSSCGDSKAIRIDKEILNGWDLEESIKFEISDTIDFSSNIFFDGINSSTEVISVSGLQPFRSLI